MSRMMVTLLVVALLAAGVYGGITGVFTRILPVSTSMADVPTQINHQGVVSVNGVRFTGSGQFKFAIINATGVNQWTNDGTHLGQTNTAPEAAVSLAVLDGVYTVRLGDTALTNMTTVPTSIFSDGSLKLRIWFNDGTNGVHQLSPDQALTTSPYAFTVADGAVTSDKIASEAVSSGKLASDVASLNKVSGGAMSATGSNVTATGNVTANTVYGTLGDVVTARAIDIDYTAPYTTDAYVTEFDITINVPKRSVIQQEFSGNYGRAVGGYCYPTLYHGSTPRKGSHIPSYVPDWGYVVMHDVYIVDAGSHAFRVRMGALTGEWRFFAGIHTITAIPTPN